MAYRETLGLMYPLVYVLCSERGSCDFTYLVLFLTVFLL
jgi:hypothetical protein